MMMFKGDVIGVVIDFQTKLVPAMKEKERIIDKTSRLIRGLKVFGAPILVTQQYTKGLGNTVPELAEVLGDFDHIEKNDFSCWQNPDFRKALEKTGRKTVVIAGIETHICVLQTAIDLVEAGYSVYICEDCCSTRDLRDHMVGLMRLEQEGVKYATAESVLMELTGGAKAAEFKEISNIIK